MLQQKFEHAVAKVGNNVRKVKVKQSDLPLHCPMPNESSWNSHPRVYIPIEEDPNASCPYCGIKFELTD